MKKKSTTILSAYIDEYGAFGWDLENEGTSKFFILTAAIVEPQNIQTVKEGVIEAQKLFFGNTELKSKGIKGNHKRRVKVLEHICQLPFKFISMVYDKRLMADMPGLKYKSSFYKFLNQSIYSTLIHAFNEINIYGDAIGESDFMESFLKYMRGRLGQPTLFDSSTIDVVDSKKELIIQIADIISGTLAYIYDDSKSISTEYKDQFIKLLDKKKIRIDLLPYTYHNFNVETSPAAKDYDKDIAEICFMKAKNFIEQNEGSKDEDTIRQILVLKYLLFRFMNNNQRKYISTKELNNYLADTHIGRVSTQVFRNKIVGKLRDNDVIIASSPYGYKIPTQISDINDYLTHSNTIIIPMLQRIKKCSNSITLSSYGKIKPLNNDNCKLLKQIIDIL